jgi:ABC-type arginine transport system ATPase subunit
LKKLDLHIHTLSTEKDASFSFSIDVLNDYIDTKNLDIIAITNHNTFDLNQYKMIQEGIKIKVLPGIEVDLENGHILIISSDEQNSVEKFNHITDEIEDAIKGKKYLKFEEFVKIFSDLNEYLFIPHIEGKPKSLSYDVIERFGDYVFCGEVPNQSKFKILKRDPNFALTPLIFSDLRVSNDLSVESYSVKQTYLSIETSSFESVKAALRDNTKVFLNKFRTELFDATGSNDFLYPGVNIITGKRSTGKTVFLKNLFENNDNVKYIKQFELVQNQDDEEKDIETFKQEIKKDEYRFIDSHLSKFKDLATKISLIDIESNLKASNEYADNLVGFATDKRKKNHYSQTKIFSEEEFLSTPTPPVFKLIDSIVKILDHYDDEPILQKYLYEVNFKGLLRELIKKAKKFRYISKLKTEINDVLRSVQPILQSKTNTKKITNYDHLAHIKNEIMIDRFNTLVNKMKKDTEVFSSNMGDFRIIVNRKEISSAETLRKRLKTRGKVSHVFALYNQPYNYLKLMIKEGLANDIGVEKSFFEFDYEVKNRFGKPVSGGERSEFRLIRALKDAYDYDMLLIDEPESSFDNVFLRERINSLIKSISEHLPVVIVTHNNTVGLSIRPDYIYHMVKSVEKGIDVYEKYSGKPDSKKLKSIDGKAIDNFSSLIDSFESGEEAYNERKRDFYDVAKDR